ncbi:MGMT family protein [Candidatus Woesebacteria bacterium]|nr:MGMT family protein [Candidatus Woesebacteria bacterium]
MDTQTDLSFFERVYRVVRSVPVGYVTTYGDIARAIGTKDSRRIGHALHANSTQETPCHRVVFADGSLASGFAFGGPNEQLRLLEFEGIGFTPEGKVDLTKYRYKGTFT